MPGEARLLSAARGKFGCLLLALIVLLATAPAMTEGAVWKLGLALLASFVLVAGLYAVRPGRRSLIVGAILASMEFATGRLVAAYGAQGLLLLQIILWIAFLGYVTLAILEWVLGSPEVTLETLQAAFCVYLLLGLLWAYVYSLMAVTMPGSFRVEHGPAVAWTDQRSRRLQFMRLFIFSYSTLTGTGRGDLVPSNGFADMAASLEAMSAQVYLAVVIARLVGMHAGRPRPAGPDEPGDATGTGPGPIA